MGIQLMAHSIAVIPGDCVGPEVIREGVNVLRKLGELGLGDFEFTEFPWGAGHFLKTGAAMPPDGLEILKGFEAIYFGAHGDPARVPNWVGAKQLLQPIRRGFEEYANVRPGRLLPGVVSPIRDKSNIDMVVVRENSEGEYAGMGGRLHIGTPDEMAVQTTVITRRGADRVIRFAFELARMRNGKKRVSTGTKPGALVYSMTLWDEVFDEVSLAYPDVDARKHNHDALCMEMIAHPDWFDVIVATSMVGDILSDEAAVITGGVSLAPGANLNPERKYPSLFEPIHGSAPDIAGKGIANPIATIMAGKMLAEWVGEAAGADLILKAVEQVVAEGKVRTGDLGGRSSTSEVGDAIRARMETLAARGGGSK
jgi:tartrate dehydrogenase/decarboxylase/D-malate dehydrogenase